jgi:hypothetical protein
LRDRRGELGRERGTGAGVEPARVQEHAVVHLEHVLRIEAAEPDIAAREPVGRDRDAKSGRREHAVHHANAARTEGRHRPRRCRRQLALAASLTQRVTAQLRLGPAVARLLGQRILQ